MSGLISLNNVCFTIIYVVKTVIILVIVLIYILLRKEVIIMDRRVNKMQPLIRDRHPSPAESMRLIEEQNRRNGSPDITRPPSLEEQLRSQQAIYQAVNAPHAASVRRGLN